MERHELYDGKVVMFYDDGPHKYWEELQDKILADRPSSTQITNILDKPGLRYWYVNKALERVQAQVKPGRGYDEVQLERIFKKAKYGGADSRDESASVGRLVHDWVEKYVKSAIFDGMDTPQDLMHTGAQQCVDNFLDWEFHVNPEYIFSERRMISKESEFAGTLDIAAYVDPFHLGLAKKVGVEKPVPTIIDIKTGKNVYPEYWLQLASYCLMLSEEQPEGFQHILPDMQRFIINISQMDGSLKTYTAKSDIRSDADTFLALREVYLWKEGR